MAVIDKKDIYSGGDPFAEVNKSLKELDGYIAKLKNETKQYADELRRVEKTGGGKEAKKRVEQTEKLSRSTKQLTEAQKARKKINQQLERTQAQLNEVGSKRSRQLERNKQQLKNSNALQKKIIAAQKAERNSVDKLQKINGVLVEKRKNLNLQTRRGQKLYDTYTKKIKANTEQLKKHDSAIGRNQRNVGNYTQSIKDAVGSFSGFNLGIAGLVAGLGKLVSVWAKWQTQLEKTRHEIRVLTDASGEYLDEITAKSQAVAKTFNQDLKRVTESANALAKQMNISYSEAMDVIENGFVNGANAGGNFLDILREYPAQLKEVGLSADEAVSVITQQVKSGVFSDKGIDAIKEANIRIREMTDRTREAINSTSLNAERIQEQLVSKEKSMFEVIQMISAELEKLSGKGQATGQIIADVFGGPGEDAGLEYLKTLNDVGVGMDSVREKTDEYTKAQRQMVDANEDLSEAMQTLAGGAWWTQIKAKVVSTVADIVDFAGALTDLKNIDIKTYFKALVAPLRLIPGFDKFAKTIVRLGKAFARLTGITATVNAITKLGKRLNIFSDSTKKAKEETSDFNSVLEAHKNLMEELRKSNVENNEKEKKSFKKLQKELKRGYKEQTLTLKKQLANREITVKQYNDRMKDAEMSFLRNKKQLLQEHGKDTIEVERKIAEKRGDIIKNALKGIRKDPGKEVEIEEQKNAKILANKQEVDAQLAQSTIDRIEKQEAAERRRKERIKQRNREIANELTAIGEMTAIRMGETLGNFFASADKQNQKFLQSITMSLLGAVESAVNLLIAKIVAQELGSKSFAGIATSAVLTGIVKGLFNQAKQSVRSNMGETSTPQYAEGGEVGGKKHSEGGTPIEAEKGEYVVKADSYGKSKELVQAVNAGKVTDADYKTLQNISVNNSVSNARLEKLLESTNAQMQQNTKVLGRLGNVFEYKGFIYKELASGETIKLRKA